MNTAGWIGKHFQDVVFFAVIIIVCGEELFLLPDFLPFLFAGAMIVAFCAWVLCHDLFGVSKLLECVGKLALCLTEKTGAVNSLRLDERDLMMANLDGLAGVMEAVTTAEKTYGRQAGSANLIAVSKTKGEEDIRPGLDAGQRLYGENRVQEAAGKWPALREDFPDIELHLIGPLQSNKAKEAVALFDVIHTVDREKIAKALASEMKRQGRDIPCTIQVNTGAEPQKAGIDPKDAPQFLEYCRVEGLNIIGLMCIPPLDDNPGPHFALLRKLADDLGLETLSMGMSGDFVTAIQFGATHVRVGSALFGARDYPQR